MLLVRQEPTHPAVLELAASLQREFYSRGFYAAADQWITIGGSPGDGGVQHAGGTPVAVDEGGQITKGPGSLKGRDMDEFKLRPKRNKESVPKHRQRELIDKASPPPPPAEGKSAISNFGPWVTKHSDGRIEGPSILNIDQIAADPSRFQYKIEDIDAETGVTDKFSDARFRPEFAGRIDVWYDPKAKQTFVINGHHRYELAKRAGYTGALSVQMIDAKNENAARTFGALTNIAGENGTALDAAQFFIESKRTVEDLLDEGISVKGHIARDGLLLSKLSENLFRRLKSKQLSTPRAMMMAEHLGDSHDLQNQAFQELIEAAARRNITDATAVEMIKDIAESPTIEEDEKDLFGSRKKVRSLRPERADARAALRKELAAQSRIFKDVSKKGRAKRLAEAGNVIDEKENKRLADQAAGDLWTFDKLVARKGELSDAINRTAEQLGAEPKRKDEILDNFIKEARPLLSAALGQGIQGDSGGGEGYSRAQQGGRYRRYAFPILTQTEPPVMAINRSQVLYYAALLQAEFSHRERYAMPSRYAAGWNEGDHPRADDGKFGSGGGTATADKPKREPGDTADKGGGPDADGRMGEGERRTTVSGRQTTPFPRVDVTSNRKAQNTEKRVDAWLQANAIAEAESRDDEFNARMFRDEKPGKIPPASKDSMELYLFDEIHGQPAADKAPEPKPDKTSKLKVGAKVDFKGDDQNEAGKGEILEVVEATDRKPEGYRVKWADGREYARMTAEQLLGDAYELYRRSQEVERYARELNAEFIRREHYRVAPPGAALAGAAAAKWEESKHPRADDGKFGHGGGGGASDEGPASDYSDWVPSPSELRAVQHRARPRSDIPGPTGEDSPENVAEALEDARMANQFHNPDPNDGISSRVGVPAGAIPPPPPIPRLPNLTPEEREIETRFSDWYESDPEGHAERYMDKMLSISKEEGTPPLFETDAAKLHSLDFHDPSVDTEENLRRKSVNNTALHQTANALAKRSFVKYLDRMVEAGDTRPILVTAGGVASGKSYGIANVPAVKAVQDKSGAVWDSAGEANSTECEWIGEEATKRGLAVNYVYTHNDPDSVWANPGRGVVDRAVKKGRMVDARPFADSYAHGPKNFKAFADSQAGNANASFHYLNNNNGPNPQLLSEIPPEALQVDADALYQRSLKHLATADVLPRIKQGATNGLHIWPQTPAAPAAAATA